MNQSKVVLFIKGSPQEPRCGFSRKIVGLLKDKGVEYKHFDILTDESVRQGTFAPDCGGILMTSTIRCRSEETERLADLPAADYQRRVGGWIGHRARDGGERRA